MSLILLLFSLWNWCEAFNISSFQLRNEFLLFTVLARSFGLYPCLFPKLHSVLLLFVHGSMPAFCSLAAHLWPCQPNNWLCERDWIITEALFMHTRWVLGPLAVCMENCNLSVTLQSSFCQAKQQLSRVIGQGSSKGIWLASSASWALIIRRKNDYHRSQDRHPVAFYLQCYPYAIQSLTNQIANIGAEQKHFYQSELIQTPLWSLTR